MRAKFDCQLQFDADALAARAKAAGDRALLRAGEQVRVRSAMLAPRRSGNLAASGSVEAAPGKVTVRYGAAYAAIQHERADFHHPNGGQANFLRAAIEDPATAQALANYLAQELGAGG